MAAFAVFVAQCGKPSIQERAAAMDARERAEAHQFNVDRAAKAAAEAAALAARDRDRVGPSAVDAWVMAKHFVTNSLKSPSTADFGSLLDGTYQSGDDCCHVLSGGAWRCSGWVDAQNSFGAKTRANFTIDMKPSGTGWVVTNGPDLTER
ncbi:MAG TPA: hypothetical protein VHW01_05965 [Polyangiaceae bacterium]|nr:hypothetical protein [Polyangiaceae bacterium]